MAATVGGNTNTSATMNASALSASHLPPSSTAPITPITPIASTTASAAQRRTSPAANAGAVVMPIFFRAEDVRACQQARQWTDAAVEELLTLARLTAPVSDADMEAAYRRAIAENPCEVESFAGLTSLLSRQARHDEALEVVDQALGWCHDVALLHHHAGCALAAAGRVAEAIDAHHQSLQLDAGLSEAHYALGMLYETVGEPRRSARHFQAFSRTGASPVSRSAAN